ncbi:MAG TPA: hypothetical protein VNT52_18130 [Acidimicrobiales bacterium]|nr:hypothetical protein [Acidimicrobiales bacterium]
MAAVPYSHVLAPTRITLGGTLAFVVGDPIPLATADRLGLLDPPWSLTVYPPYADDGDSVIFQHGVLKSMVAAAVADAIDGIGPGTYAGDAELAALLDPIIVGAITRDANGAATSAGVVWPDGTAGAYTATTVSSAFPGAVDAYTVTKGALTFTQPAVTRNSDGAVTNRPAVTVA